MKTTVAKKIMPIYCTQREKHVQRDRERESENAFSFSSSSNK
jgi:hypothetical protein